MDLSGQASARQRLRLTNSLSPPRKRLQNGLALKIHLPAQRFATHLTLQAGEPPPNGLYRQNIAPQFLNFTPTAHELTSRCTSSGAAFTRNDGSDLHFLREPTIGDLNPLTQMTLTDSGKLMLGTLTEKTQMTLQVGDDFGVTPSGRIGFENAIPAAKIHFSNTSLTDCIRFPNGTVQNTAPFTDAGYVSGPGGVPAVSSTAFMTPVQLLRVTHNSQKVFVTASAALYYHTPASGLFVYIGYRRFNSGSAPTLIGQGLYCSIWVNLTGANIAMTIPVSVSAIIENLDPGLYEFGMAGYQRPDAGDGWNLYNGYATAFVF